MNRYSDRKRYFSELAKTSERYYLDYLRRFKPFGMGSRVLEVGCGEGGNLLPFAQAGCEVVGVDISRGKIDNAICFFKERDAVGEFLRTDFLEEEMQEGLFDIVIAKDIMEHIAPEKKERFLRRVRLLLRPDGIAFFGFPAWQMPFGGHQQTCREWICAHLPWTHLLPERCYRSFLSRSGEDAHHIDELMEIRRCRMNVELFERLCNATGFQILDRTLWLVNPHYRAKFGLIPLRLRLGLDRIPGLRDVLSTSCFFILRQQQTSR